MGVCGCCYCRPARRMKEEPEQVSSCKVIPQVKEENTKTGLDEEQLGILR